METVTLPGVGVDVSVDDCGADGKVQVIKLAISTDGSATLIPANATDGLLVNLGSNNDVTVTGSVTANAGTNLNTSALALESGGNLAAAATSLALVDDTILADNAGFTDGTTKLSMAGFIFDEVAGTALTENDAAAGRINANRALVGVIEDGATRARYATVTAANAVKVDGSAVTQPVSASSLPLPTNAATEATLAAASAKLPAALGQTTMAASLSVTIASNQGAVPVSGTVTADTELPAAAALADNTANPTVPAVGAFNMVYDGSTWDRAPGTSADGMLVNLGANNDVTVTSGTVTLGAGTANIGDVDILSVPAPLNVTGEGAGASALRVVLSTDWSGSLGVTMDGRVNPDDWVAVRLTNGTSYISALPVTDNGGALTVDNGGTFAVQVDGAALTALQLLDDTVFADDAAFTVGTSKVSMAGFQAVAHGSNPDAADALDAVAAITNRHRVPFMIGGHPNPQLINLNVSDADGAQTNAAIITAGAGTKIVVTHITVAVDSATTATGGVAVRIGFGTASTPALDAGKVLISHSGIAAGSGIVLGNGGGILGVGADDEDLRITCEDPTGGNIDVVVGYYTIEG